MSAVLTAASAWWLIAALQISGIIAACVMRSAQPDRMAWSAQAIFFVLLAVAAVTTFIGLSISPATWFFSCASLATMVLVAILDTGPHRTEPSTNL